MSYPVQQVIKPQPSIIIDYISINILSIDLGESANIEVKLLNPNCVSVGVERLTLVQPEYSEWVDDNWLVNWVFRQLGFSHPTV